MTRLTYFKIVKILNNILTCTPHSQSILKPVTSVENKAFHHCLFFSKSVKRLVMTWIYCFGRVMTVHASNIILSLSCLRHHLDASYVMRSCLYTLHIQSSLCPLIQHNGYLVVASLTTKAWTSWCTGLLTGVRHLCTTWLK